MASAKKIEAWLEQVMSGKAQTDKARIYRMLSACERTLGMFLDHGWKHQTVTARLSDLMDEGLVGETSDGWFFVVPAHGREKARLERLYEKRDRVKRQLEHLNKLVQELAA